MALDPITKAWESYKVGTRVRIRTGVADEAPKLNGVVVRIEPPGTGGGSLELYTIELDKPSRLRFGDQRTRPNRNPKFWRTDSSMCERLHILEDLSEL